MAHCAALVGMSLCVKNWEMPNSVRRLRQKIRRRRGRPPGPGVTMPLSRRTR